MTTFRDLGVSDEVVRALAARGIETPFPIQIMVIEDATSGRDTLARSKTGSGKTLGFAIPIVDQVDPEADRRPAALVLTPTRELAQQVSDAFEDIAKAKDLRVMAVYGGTNVREQSKGVGSAHILIATPGRLDDLVERGLVRLDGVKILVLDEADRMLDMGFQPQVDRIVRRLPKDRQTMFFSATLDGAIGRMADVYTRNPVRHEVDLGELRFVEEADHRFIPVAPQEKLSDARAAGVGGVGIDARVREHEASGRPSGEAAPRRGGSGRRDARRHDAASTGATPCTVSRRASSGSSSRPTWPPGGSTSSGSPWS